MHVRPGSFRILTLLALLGGGLAVAVPGNSYGDSSPWVPAHGKRKRGDPYIGYSGKKWDKHFGVLAGRCNREVIGDIVDATPGGAPGSKAGTEERREIAMLVGSVAGAVAGANVGRGPDEIDRACIGHGLELVGDKRSVTWASADNRRTYRFFPVRSFAQDGVKCREFDFRVTTSDGIKKTNRVKACTGGDGTWRLVD